MEKKWRLALLVAFVIALGLWFVPLFEDPYHEEGKVNVYIWAYRELKELVHGEK